jgi:hypothetical protein
MAAQENPGGQKAQSKLIENDLWDLDDDEDIQDDTPESSENPSAADGRQSANETETTDQAEAERHLAEKAPAEENIPETPAPAPTEPLSAFSDVLKRFQDRTRH